jgi:DedD protein
METETERTKPKVIRHPGSEKREGVKDLESTMEKSEKSFAFLVVGAFLFALIAFICGVRLGKTLTDWNPGEKSLSQTKVQIKGEEESSLLTEGEKAETARSPETKIPAAATLENQQEKDKSPPPPQQKVSEQKSEIPAKEMAASSEKSKEVPSAKAKFTVQVAALNNAEEAREMVNQLRNQGYVAYQITGTAAAKGTWYRVRVGYFQTLPEARQFALAFEKKEKIKTLITSIP